MAVVATGRLLDPRAFCHQVLNASVSSFRRSRNSRSGASALFEARRRIKSVCCVSADVALLILEPVSDQDRK
jgi:hypothetical protein